MTLIELTLETAIKEAGEFLDVRLSKEDAEYVLDLIKKQEINTIMDREKVIENMNIAKAVLCNPNMITPEMSIKIGQTISDAISLLKEQKPKTGHWIFESQYCEAWSHTCSECGKRITTAANTFANWCWNCGAKMTNSAGCAEER